MRTLLIAIFCATVLLTAGTAHAYAMYSHVGFTVCVEDRWDQAWGECKFEIPPNGTHNGEHGASLNHIIVVWDYDKQQDCRCTQNDFDIPKGGWATIYQDVVKIYHHDGSSAGSREVTKCDCAPGSGGPAKQCK